MIGLHIVLKKKMHIVTKTTSGGTSISGTNWRQIPLIAPGRKHRKNAVIMIATSSAAFYRRRRLLANLVIGFWKFCFHLWHFKEILLTS